MKRWYPEAEDSVLARVLWLYGVYALIGNGAFLVGYYLLPEGILRVGPQTAAALVVADAGSFTAELLLTIAFNIGLVVAIAVVMNLSRVRGLPAGYIYPLLMGLVSGLVPGTNSFVSSDLTDLSVREGLALANSIGNLEMLGYICVIAATAGIGLYEYKSWWRSGKEWKAEKTRSFRDIRLSRSEWITAGIGVLLVLIAALRETMLSYGQL